MNSIIIALAVVAFIADSYMHRVLYVSIHGCMSNGIRADDIVAIRKYII